MDKRGEKERESGADARKEKQAGKQAAALTL